MFQLLPIRLIGALYLVATLLVGAVLTLSHHAQPVELQWHTFVEDGMAEKSVFIRRDGESLWRVTPDLPLWLLNEPLYATTDQLQWGPFHLFQNALGPYSMGEELGVTLADWLRAQGTGTYRAYGDMALVELSFTNLVPNSLYTLWCVSTIMPPDFETIVVPCGAPDGTDNAFFSNDNGGLNIKAAFQTLPETNDTRTSLLALAWHSDAQSHGKNLGPTGYKTFIHLYAVIMFPAKEGG